MSSITSSPVDFQCWTLKSRRAWFTKSCAVHHSMVEIMNFGGINRQSQPWGRSLERAWEWGWSAIWTLTKVPLQSLRRVLIFLELSCIKNELDLKIHEFRLCLAYKSWPSNRHTYHPRISIKSSLDSFLVSLHSKALITSHLGMQG